jgi:hypothetical protein
VCPTCSFSAAHRLHITQVVPLPEQAQVVRDHLGPLVQTISSTDARLERVRVLVEDAQEQVRSCDLYADILALEARSGGELAVLQRLRDDGVQLSRLPRLHAGRQLLGPW